MNSLISVPVISTNPGNISVTIDELHFTWDRHVATQGNRNDAAAGKPPGFDEYIDMLEQFDWRGEADTTDHHIDKRFVLPAKPEEGNGYEKTATDT